VPANVAAAVGKALEKLPADRFEGAKAFADALADPGFRHGGGVGKGADASAATARARTRDPAFVTLAAVSFILAVVAAWAWFRTPTPEMPVGRFEFSIPGGPALAVAADGGSLVFLGSTTDGNDALMQRTRGDPEPRSLGVGTGWTPFFSPDGDSIGYFTGFPGALMTVAMGGSVPRVIVPDSTVGYGGAWGDDGTIYYTSNHGDLMGVSTAGDSPRVVARPDLAQGQRQIVEPDLLPGGEAAIVTVFGDGAPQVGVTDLTTGTTRIIATGSIARFAPPDHVFVGRETGEIVALPFDARRRVVTGAEVPFATDLALATGGNVTGLGVTRGGEVFYAGGRDDVRYALVRVDRGGREQVVDPDWHDMLGSLNLSPDGTKLAVDLHRQGRDEVWIKTLDRGSLTPLASGGVLSYRPSWSADGGWIYFLSDRDPAHPESVYRVAAAGGVPELLYRGDRAVDEAEVSADGRWLVYRAGSGGGRDVFAVRLGSDSAPVPVAATGADERALAVSPDGRFVAYVSDESGRSEVWVRPLSNPAEIRWAVSIQGGSEPRWAHSGRELFYRSARDSLIDVRLAPGPAFQVADRKPLFSVTDYVPGGNYVMYDVLPDDQGFLFQRFEGDLIRSTIMVVQNWRKALEARQGR
jgi:hypothetical protein